MQTCKNNLSTQFDQHSALSIGRLIACIIVGAIVTFVLFVIMHALIAQKDTAVPIDEPLVFVSSILDLQEEKTIIRPKPKPLPKVEIKPITPLEMPLEPSGAESFANAITLPPIATEKQVFAVGPVDQQPRPIIRFTPKYPVPAAAKGIEGFVSLSFAVSASGEVVDIRVIESEPRNTFDRAATQALRKWRYQPKIVNGTPVRMLGLSVRLDFSLGDN